jgi:NAD(P)-dependent dehydrogenase (short-subunit alcohol dehydrogenase family)
MRELAGKSAFVTGGASGIGLALGEAFAGAGMKVTLADIETAQLAAAVKRLQASGADVLGVTCDVADRHSVGAGAREAAAAFGPVHILCNNAGVAGGSGIETISADTWRWVLDVNVMGAVHGVGAFLPQMLAHGEGGHIVNMASLAGLVTGRFGFSPYAASKHALVSMSEGLATQLAPLGIGVTVVCPGHVRTRIAESHRNRPSRYGPAPVLDSQSWAGQLAAAQAAAAETGVDPASVASQVLRAVREDELYVFTRPEMRSFVAERFAAVLAAMDKAASG